MEIVGILTALATLMGGFWALQAKQAKNNKEVIEAFLETLTKKNGHNERIVETFNKTIQEYAKINEKISEQLERANDNNLNIQGVLTNCALAMKDYYEIIKKK